MKVGRRQRVALYAVAALLWLSGAGHWLLGRTAESSGGDSLAAAEWRHRMLALHGAGAMLFLVVLGSLVPNHLRRTWRAGANRASGLVAVGIAAWLGTTGWILYYGGGEQLRAAAVVGHDLVGFLLPLALLLHVVLGRRWRRDFLRRARR